MMNLIKTMAMSPDNDSAIRYLVVDAINNKNVIDYYVRNGFEFLFESDEEELKCLRPQVVNKSIFRQIKDLFRLSNKNDKFSCKTRLMYFDLIPLKQ